jgi:hypothetical protein
MEIFIRGFTRTSTCCTSNLKLHYSKTPFSILKEFIPYTQIAATSCGYSRNIDLLRIIIVLILMFFYSSIRFKFSLITWLILYFIIIFSVVFYFSKRIFLLVESAGTLTKWVRFSEGVLDNVKIELQDIERISTILNKITTKIQMKK